MFSYKLSTYREAINKELKKFLDIFYNKDCNFVCDAIKYSLLEGGKLLRPVLTLAVCEMFLEDFKKALPFACAVEFIHVGSLIHDDLPCMDDDSKRRGRPSCHVKFDEATAVLAGDSLFCSAFKILTYGKDYGLDEAKILNAVSFLAEMFGTKGIIAGQDMDMFCGLEDSTKEMVEKIANYKTCSLIRAACRLGALVAGANKEEIEIIDRYANSFGLCFQIRDDILDFVQSRKKEKLDFLYFYNLNEAEGLAKKYNDMALEFLYKLKGSEFLVELTKKTLYRDH